MKRLEDRLRYRLLERMPRTVQLSAQGLSLLKPARNFVAAHESAIAGLSDSARRLVVGISDQVAGHSLLSLQAKLSS